MKEEGCSTGGDNNFLAMLHSTLGFVLDIVLPRSGRRTKDLGHRPERKTVLDIASWDDCIWNVSKDFPGRWIFLAVRAGYEVFAVESVVAERNPGSVFEWTEKRPGRKIARMSLGVSQFSYRRYVDSLSAGDIDRQSVAPT